jgi:hypothetical protein
MRIKQRLAIVVLCILVAVAAAGQLIGRWHFEKMAVWMSITAAIVSAVSGYLSLRNEDDLYSHLDSNHFGDLVRNMFHSVRTTAIFLLQIAVLFQSIALVL